MAQGEKVDPKAISQATVRRDVVVNLIQLMKDRGHREYAKLNMNTVKEHAAATLHPRNDGQDALVPEEVLAILQKKLSVSQERPGKASAF